MIVDARELGRLPLGSRLDYRVCLVGSGRLASSLPAGWVLWAPGTSLRLPQSSRGQPRVGGAAHVAPPAR